MQHQKLFALLFRNSCKKNVKRLHFITTVSSVAGFEAFGVLQDAPRHNRGSYRQDLDWIDFKKHEEWLMIVGRTRAVRKKLMDQKDQPGN